MRKRIWMGMLMLLMGIGILRPVQAAVQRVYDDALLLTEDEEQKLQDDISELTAYHQLDIVIVTTEDTRGKSTQDYADDFYDSHHVGDDFSGSGILLLLDMEHREAYISTTGRAIDSFTTQKIDLMLDRIVERLSEEEYYGACGSFLQLVDDFDDMKSADPPTWKERFLISLRRSPYYLIAAVVIGAIYAVALVAGRGYKNTTNYTTYQDKNQFHLVQRDDFFLRETTTSRKISSDTGNKSGGGGSSTHTSSGGVRHGGGGRKF